MKSSSDTRSSASVRLAFLALAAGAFALPVSVSAALTIYEPFNYATGSLSGQNGGFGFASGWTATTGTSTVATPSLSYSTLPSLGNRATTAAATATTQTRSLTSALGNGTYYISFLLRPDNTAAANNAEFALIGSTANLYVGKPTSGSNYVLDTSASAGGTQNASSVAYANGATVLMVLKATLGAGGDSFQLYINPGVSAEPSSGDAAKSGYDIGNITSLQFTGNLGFSIDELKVGSAYADAVPETGTWGSVFAVLGIGCVAWLRHRDATRKTKSPSPAAPLTAIPKSVS
jgi:hypothetical protein